MTARERLQAAQSALQARGMTVRGITLDPNAVREGDFDALANSVAHMLECVLAGNVAEREFSDLF